MAREVWAWVGLERQVSRGLCNPVERFMSPDVVACRSDEDLSLAQDLMGEMQVSRIVCVSDDGRLEGVISLSDIAQVADGSDIAATLRSVTVREARA